MAIIFPKTRCVCPALADPKGLGSNIWRFDHHRGRDVTKMLSVLKGLYTHIYIYTYVRVCV